MLVVIIIVKHYNCYLLSSFLFIVIPSNAILVLFLAIIIPIIFHYLMHNPLPSLTFRLSDSLIVYDHLNSTYIFFIRFYSLHVPI